MLGAMNQMNYLANPVIANGWLSSAYVNGITSYDNSSYAIEIDSSGNSYVAGYMSPIDGLPNFRVFTVIKYSPTSVPLWTATYNGNIGGTSITAWDLKVDSSGNVYACGGSTGTTGYSYGIVMKFDSSGTLQWQRLFKNSTSLTTGYSMAIDDTGSNIYIAGAGAVGTTGFFLVKYTSAGALSWATNMETTTTATQYGLAYTGGNVYVSGYRIGSGVQYGLLWKVNSSGTTQWTKDFADTKAQFYGIAAKDASTDSGVYLCGLTNDGADRWWVGSLTSDATVSWQKYLTASGSFAEYGLDITTDGTSVYATGFASDGYQSRIRKYNTSGTEQWARYIIQFNPGQPLTAQTQGITCNSDSYYVTGQGFAQPEPHTNLGIVSGKLSSTGNTTGTYSLTGENFVYGDDTYLTTTTGAVSLTSSSYTTSSMTMSNIAGNLTSYSTTINFGNVVVPG